MNRWYVLETKCYPKAYKVAHEIWGGSNYSWNFYESHIEAQKEADRRNKLR